jgi:HEAT repeat protein
MATFCGGEGDTIKRSGRNWERKVLKIAANRRGKPIQKIFDSSWEELDYEDHIRVWSWFDVFLADDPERFVAFTGLLRERVDHRTAMKRAFGCSPEEFDQRWRDRVLGLRPTAAATPAELDAANPDRPGAAERAAIRNEKDPDTLASRIRALGTVTEPLTAATIVPHLASESPNVRERIVLLLSATKDESVREWLRTDGLRTASGIVRGHVARIIGNLADPAAGDELMKYADDGLWFTRAHVARALGLIVHEPAKEFLKEMVGDSSPKVRIAAMDALARFGKKGASAWEPVSEQLSNGAWQVRSAAAACLGGLGDMHAVDPLIDRMEVESGRIRRDIRAALKKITRDDLGKDPKYWRDWWEKERERRDGALPPRADEKEAPPEGEHDYAEEPTYYGIRVFSEGIGYVLDVSSSMVSRIKIDPAWLKRHNRDYPAEAKKFDLARSEIEASLRSLDPRARFNIFYFRGDAFAWKNSLVPATPGNIDSAVGRMGAEEPPPPDRTRTSGKAHLTNYVDAFRLALDVDEGSEANARFGDTPDTIFFLTDGQPTSGDITEPDALLSWFAELNRFARVKVNVITFGRLGSDPAFLRSLAEDNGGTFVLVPEVR